MKFLSINKSQAAFISTMLVLITLVSCYFFIYLPSNEKRIQEQHFQALQNIDQNIHIKIENSKVLLKNLLTAYKDETRRAHWEEYTRLYPSNNFTFIKPESVLPKVVAPTNTKNDYTVKLDDAVKSINLQLPNQGSGESNAKDNQFNDKDSVYSIKLNSDTREILLSYSRRMPGQEGATLTVGMKFTFEQFIQFLLPKEVFDEYVVFSKGKPVYQSFPAGISYAKEDSLLGAKNGFGSSSTRNQVIGGTDYKMFLQPVGFDANNEWVIGGLLTARHYQNEKTQLPTQLILLLVTILLVSMVAFPWLKLYQMGSKDRLTISDGIASIFISMLLVSLIVFIFFNYNFLFRPSGNSDARIVIANGISKAFKSEVGTSYHKLRQLDSLKADQDKQNSIPDKDIINLNKSWITFADRTPVPNASVISDVITGINVNQVFWMNRNGREINNWAVDTMNGPRGNFRNRDYFKKLIEQRPFYLDDTGTKRFYLDQGISWTTGAFRSVISIPSASGAADSPVVAAMSFNFRSLDSVILPAGYLFAIADQSANVLYHSDPVHNLNENLLNVFSQKDKLKSYLDSKAEGSFTTKYYGNDYEIRIQPVNALPYFIVIFENAIFQETIDMETYSFTFSMLFFFFAFLVLQLLAIFLVSAKRSFLKKQLFDTSWIGPKISNRHEYVLASVLNCCIIVLLIYSLAHTTFLQYLFMLLLSVTFIPLFLNSVQAMKYYREKSDMLAFKRGGIICLCVFTCITGVTAFRLLMGSNFWWFALYGIVVILLALLIYFTRENIYRFIDKIKASSVMTPFFDQWDYVNSFALMALTRLMITSALPVVFFYISSHNYEQNLSIRYKQTDFAARLLNKFPGLPPGSIINENNKTNGVYYDSSLIKSVSVVDGVPLVRKYEEEDKSATNLLKFFRLYITNEAVIEDQFDKEPTGDSSFFFNHLLREACEKGTGSITYNRSSSPGKYLALISANLNYQYPSVFKWVNGNTNEHKFRGLIFWGLLVSTLLLFYFVIVTIIKKLFSLNLPKIEVWNKLDDEILIAKKRSRPLFVIGLPGSGKKKYLLDKIANGEIAMDDGTPLHFDSPYEQKNNVFIAELINIPSSGNEEIEKAIWEKYTRKVFEEKNRIIIVNHFEYNIQDPLSNRFKLEFLERLYLEDKCKIFILSTIHPVAFLDSAMDPVFMPKDKSVPGQDLERWHVLLGHYRIIILPLQLPIVYPFKPVLDGNIVDELSGRGIQDADIQIVGSEIGTYTVLQGRFSLPEYEMPFELIVELNGYDLRRQIIQTADDLRNITLARDLTCYGSADLVRRETRRTYFLKQLQQPAYRAGQELSEKTRMDRSDELDFKIQISSHYFYMYIWQSLTKEEKFLLYDLAEDNLVNAFDDYNLSMLIAKGVVTRPDGTLKLFNKGFRNFILTAIGNSEAIKIKNRIRENGNWNTLKNPLQLVILAILAFLLTSQEEAFAKLLTYVVALGAAVPAVLKLFSLFDKSSQKPS